MLRIYCFRNGRNNFTILIISVLVQGDLVYLIVNEIGLSFSVQIMRTLLRKIWLCKYDKTLTLYVDKEISVDIMWEVIRFAAKST